MDILNLWFGRKQRIKVKGIKERRANRHQRKADKSKRTKVHN